MLKDSRCGLAVGGEDTAEDEAPLSSGGPSAAAWADKFSILDHDGRHVLTIV